MSKIYEALRRAERERAEEPKPVPSSSETQRETEGTLASTETDSYEIKTLTVNSAPLSVSDERRVIWEPLWAKLPSLRRRGASVEQFRSLRSRLLGLRQKTPLKSVLISSGHTEEGKTFVSVNQALILASAQDQRVVLIDGDMRRPSAHRLLGAPLGLGLSDYLTGNAELSEILQLGRAVDGAEQLPAPLAALTFIAAGSEREQAPDISASRRFETLLSSLEPHFDWIVVDSPPIALVTDAVDMARVCDGVLFVVRSGKSGMAAVKKSLASLKSVRVLGLVLNGSKDILDTHSSYGY